MSSKNTILPSQVRQARAALDLSVRELAAESGLGTATIYSFERAKRPPYESTARKLRETLEQLGAEFYEDGGVRVRGEVKR